MPRTQIKCPNCGQPIVADIEQLFDAGVDPTAKQRLLSGSFNLARCPNCGYQGNLATPIVYHDPDKELLLTFVPPEIGLPRDEQERIIGSMTTQVVNNLPQEKRKGYLFRPQMTLTMQGLIDRVLEAEGITREMIEGQQKRLSLVQRMLTASEESLEQIAKQEDESLDAEFFALLRRLVEAALVEGDEESARHLAGLQQSLLPITTFGREVQAQSQEMEAALKELQSVGRELNREKLLEFVINAPSEVRLGAYVSMARPLMDYTFFGLLSERIEQASETQKEDLIELREKLLEMTREIDRQMEARSQAARQMLEAILQADDVQNALLQNLPAVDEFFMQEVNRVQEEARKQGDLEKLGKLQNVFQVLEQASAAPPEIGLIEELLDAEDEAERRQILEDHQEEITPEFLSTLTNILGQVESTGDEELSKRLKAINRQALRFSMEKNI